MFIIVAVYTQIFQKAILIVLPWGGELKGSGLENLPNKGFEEGTKSKIAEHR